MKVNIVATGFVSLFAELMGREKFSPEGKELDIEAVRRNRGSNSALSCKSHKACSLFETRA
jgi:hypothetical protein